MTADNPWVEFIVDFDCGHSEPVQARSRSPLASGAVDVLPCPRCDRMSAIRNMRRAS